VPLLSLGELPIPHLPNFDGNAFDIDYFNFDTDYRQEWEESLEFSSIVSFDSREGIPPLSKPRRDGSSSDDSFTTCQIKNNCSVEIIIYQLLLSTKEDSIVESVGPPPSLLSCYDGDISTVSDCYDWSNPEWPQPPAFNTHSLLKAQQKTTQCNISLPGIGAMSPLKNVTRPMIISTCLSHPTRRVNSTIKWITQSYNIGHHFYSLVD
jgi:hypothetical protein